MKTKDVQLDRIYWARVGANLVPVRTTGFVPRHKRPYFEVLNLRTGRTLRRSAAALRPNVEGKFAPAPSTLAQAPYKPTPKPVTPAPAPFPQVGARIRWNREYLTNRVPRIMAIPMLHEKGTIISEVNGSATVRFDDRKYSYPQIVKTSDLEPLP